MLTPESVVNLSPFAQNEIIKTILTALEKSGVDRQRLLKCILIDCPSIEHLEQDKRLDAFAQIIKDDDPYSQNDKLAEELTKEVVRALLDFYNNLFTLNLLRAFTKSTSGSILKEDFLRAISKTRNQETHDKPEGLDFLKCLGYREIVFEKLYYLQKTGCLTANFNPCSWTITSTGYKAYKRLCGELDPVLAELAPA